MPSGHMVLRSLRAIRLSVSISNRNIYLRYHCYKSISNFSTQFCLRPWTCSAQASVTPRSASAASETSGLTLTLVWVITSTTTLTSLCPLTAPSLPPCSPHTLTPSAPPRLWTPPSHPAPPHICRHPPSRSSLVSTLKLLFKIVNCVMG